MDHDTLLRLLEQAEAQAQILAASLKTIKLALRQPVVEPEPECDHPVRVAAGTFDDPGRYMCRRCGSIVPGEKQ